METHSQGERSKRKHPEGSTHCILRYHIFWVLQVARGSIPNSLNSAFTGPQANYSSSVNDWGGRGGQAQNIKIGEILVGLPS